MMFSYLSLTVLPIFVLLSMNETTGVQCNVSSFVLQLRIDITDALNKGIDTSDMQESQCVVAESKLISTYFRQNC